MAIATSKQKMNNPEALFHLHNFYLQPIQG